jgi:hypothetical protein
LFYLDSRPVDVTNLLIAGAILLLVGAWIDYRRRSPFHSFGMARGILPFKVWASLLAGLILLLPLSLPQGFSDKAVAMVMIMLTPAAIAFLGRPGAAPPSLPAGLVIIQMLLLVLLGLLSADDVASAARFEEFSLVAVPAIGVLAGAMLYLSRMPWRAQAEVSLGTGACLSLGLLVAWAGGRIGVDESHGSMLAVMWILCVPIFEAVRLNIEALRTGILHSVSSDSITGLLQTRRSPTFLVLLVLLFGAVGISLERLQVPAAWSLIGLLSCFALYLVAPILFSFWRGTVVAQARRAG